MKTKHLLLSFFILSFLPAVLSANHIVKHLAIEVTSIDLSSSTVVGEVTIDPAETGKVIVRFDGQCWSSPGDAIVLAASNTPSWSVNEGNVSVEAVDGDMNTIPFSHTRVYNVSAGSHTFYAVAHNYVETDGDGIASIYGNLTVEFVPTGDHLVGFKGIAESGIDVSNSIVFGEITIEPEAAGKVIVNFDGLCLSSPGDRIVLAASDNTSWTPGAGNIGVEAIDADLNTNCFSHTMVYDVASGAHTFYAVVQNYVETNGDGMASVYGSLTVKFVPESAALSVNDVFNNKYHIYPIPANDVLNIEGLSPNTSLSIYSITGKELRQIKAANSTTSINISDMEKGVYFLKISAKGDAEIHKFIKE
jgi:ribosomal protein L31